MLFPSLRALCIAPGGPGSIWNRLGAPARSTRVSGRFTCGFRTDLHFAEFEVSPVCYVPFPKWPFRLQITDSSDVTIN
jgi:hypothetical protein